jgi:aromatic ring-opening dioxygenase catalytic subunit (LigB family)
VYPVLAFSWILEFELKISTVSLFSFLPSLHDAQLIVVNHNPANPLIYDFYNFPTHYYSQTFHSAGPEGGVEVVKRALEAGGWKVEPVDRGLDHGLWGE